MHTVSKLYNSILTSDNYSFEIGLIVGDCKNLTQDEINEILCKNKAKANNTHFLNSGFTNSDISSMHTSKSVFSENTFNIGCCVSGEIDIDMLKPENDLPIQAKLNPFVRITDGIRKSEWIKKGAYYIDTRQYDPPEFKYPHIKIHGYDAMLKTECDYSESKLDWPASDIQVVSEISSFIDCGVESETKTLLKGYSINFPSEYSLRETLSYIGVMNGGNFIINDFEELQFIPLNSIPAESNTLIDNFGNAITFGGVRIRV